LKEREQMRAEWFTPPQKPETPIFTAYGFSEHRSCVSKGIIHNLTMPPLTVFWADWARTRAMELAARDSVDSPRELLLEACARSYVESFACRVAALTACFGHEDLGDGEIVCWAYINIADVPDYMRVRCEAELYGTLTPAVSAGQSG
jgi:hypothetical protein